MVMQKAGIALDECLVHQGEVSVLAANRVLGMVWRGRLLDVAHVFEEIADLLKIENDLVGNMQAMLTRI